MRPVSLRSLSSAPPPNDSPPLDDFILSPVFYVIFRFFPPHYTRDVYE